MYIFHAVADESVPHENSIVAYNQFMENGAEDVYFELLPESYGGHQEAAVYCLLIAYNLSEDLKVINISGDLNSDADLNILDVVLLVSVIINQSELSTYDFWASDINNDQIINILDIITLINIVLNNE